MGPSWTPESCAYGSMTAAPGALVVIACSAFSLCGVALMVAYNVGSLDQGLPMTSLVSLLLAATNPALFVRGGATLTMHGVFRLSPYAHVAAAFQALVQGRPMTAADVLWPVALMIACAAALGVNFSRTTVMKERPPSVGCR